MNLHSRVKTLGEIGSSNNYDTLALGETIHFHEELVKSLLHVLLISRVAFAANSVKFVNEYDSWLFLPSGTEEFPNTFRAHADEHLFELRSRQNESYCSHQIGIDTYPEAKKKGTPASPATALASMVLPVPGGLMPTMRILYKSSREDLPSE